MYLVFTASKDTYITNKIMNSSYRATDGNLGRASTIDLFKLYDESVISGSTAPIELSRGLIYFELADVSSSLKGKVSFDDPSFKCKLRMFDVQGTAVAPKKFNLTVYPLSQSFDEGAGADISNFAFLDRANWVTASYSSSTNNLWNITGAQAKGTLGSSDIDIISSGSIFGGSEQSLAATQYFALGSEDMSMDVTTIVSASMCGAIENHGFLIAFSGSEETDAETRFVKRFATRHTRNPYIKPRLEITYNDSQLDHHSISEFNVTSSLFLRTFSRGGASNLVSGSALTSVSGEDCILLKLHTGSWEKYVTGSQFLSAGIAKTGIYTASIAVDSFASESLTATTTLADHISASGSITFGEEWLSLDENVSFFSGSLDIKESFNTIGNLKRNIRVSVTNLKSKYAISDIPIIRLFVYDTDQEKKAVNVPVRLKSLVLNQVYYRIRDADNGKVLIPFGRSDNSTRVSIDNEGMFFAPSLSHFVAGRPCTIDLLIVDRNEEKIIETATRFRVG